MGDEPGPAERQRRSWSAALTEGFEPKPGKQSLTSTELVPLAEPNLSPEQTKAALRELVCARRGIDYAQLAAGDPQRVEIDREIEQRLAELATQQAEVAARKREGIRAKA